MIRDAATALRHARLFAVFAEDDLRALAEGSVRRRYGPRELIFAEGEPGDGLYVVLRGHVSITRQSPDGDELWLAVLGPGDYFGELALVDGEPRSASASAVDACATLFLARTSFQEYLRAHPEAVHACLLGVVQLLRRLTDVANEVALLDVRTRLARRLVWLADQGLLASEATRRGTSLAASPPIPITQQHLANMLGATRESVNKHLRALEADGLIDLDRGQVRLRDRARLVLLGEGSL